MPVKTNYFNPINKRFDFGVPLEDIFPPNDIHPKLKHIFEEAFKLYVNNRLSLEQVVRQLQGSLETRLKLKQRIIHDVHFDIKPENIEETPGAYFWLIRHFLGLLPIPLLPTYSRDIYFDWIGLSDKCKNFLKCYESQRDRKYKLDYELAENLNLLPFEHFLLLTVLIHFIRKLSKKVLCERKLDRRTLLFLCKYYCASICVRPYTPGHKDIKMFPLFFYIALRWHSIEKYCRQIGHPAYFLEGDFNYESYANFNIRNNCVQTANFSPEIITVYRNVPYFCNNNNYLKDIGSQTEQTVSVDKCVQISEFAYDEKTIYVKDKKISNLEVNSLYPLADMNSISKDDDTQSIQGTSTPLNDKQGEKLDNIAKFSFLNSNDACNKIGWSDIVAETADTIKKVEEYIYDDYDTFSKEEYNQISEGSKSRGSLMHKVSKIGWTYTPENSAREENKERRANHNELEETYVRFDDVFDENGKYKTNGNCDDDNECEVTDKGLNTTFKKYYDSKVPLCNNNSSRSANKKHESEEKSKKNFSLKRFKLKLDFLRVLTPKKSTYSTPSYDNVESNVKYKKIKNIKSSTL